jgi:predicted ABC-type ATPase
VLLNRLFPVLIENKRSFTLDSSMSNESDTLDRIHLAKHSGYELTLVAILTPLEVSIRLAMNRAKISRRFPNPDALPKSNVLFKQYLMKYVPFFDTVFVFVNTGTDGKMFKVAEKNKQKELVVFDQNLFDTALLTAN